MLSPLHESFSLLIQIHEDLFKNDYNVTTNRDLCPQTNTDKPSVIKGLNSFEVLTI